MQIKNWAGRRDAPEIELVDDAQGERGNIIGPRVREDEGKNSRMVEVPDREFWWWAMLLIAALAGVTAVAFFVGHHQIIVEMFR